MVKVSSSFSATSTNSDIALLLTYERKLFREHQTEIVHYNNETANVWAQVITDLGNIERNSWLVNEGANGELKFVNQVYLDYWNDWLVNPQASINTIFG